VFGRIASWLSTTGFPLNYFISADAIDSQGDANTVDELAASSFRVEDGDGESLRDVGTSLHWVMS
jgi:hypothetical protein